jgi:hypothetical protein
MSPTGDDEGRTAWKFWIYAGLIVGGAVSIAANIGYTFIPPRTAPPWWPATRLWVPSDYTPPIGDVGFAAFCPIAIFITTEVMTRPRWSKGWLSFGVRAVSMALVAFPVAVASYLHLCSLLLYYSNIGAISYTLPLTVDGLMLVCTAALQMTEDGAASAPAVVPDGLEDSEAGKSEPPAADPDGDVGRSSVGAEPAEPFTGVLPEMEDGEVLLPVTPPVGTEPSSSVEQRPPVGPPQPPSQTTASPESSIAASPVAPVLTGEGETLTADRTGLPDLEDWPTGETTADPPVDADPDSCGEPQDPEAMLLVLSELEDAELVELAKKAFPPGTEVTANGVRRAFGVGTGRARRLRDVLNEELKAAPVDSASAEAAPDSFESNTIGDVITITSGLETSNH